MTPNKLFQSGHHRAFIRTDPAGMQNELYISNDGHVIFFNQGQIINFPIPDNVMLDQQHAALIWTYIYEDDIKDMFKAIAKALDLYSDEPSQAYKQGYAEGRADVYKEWNESLRGG